MTPSEDNLAANCLNEDTQNRNIRKVAVNARIAAVIWGLEIIANFCFALIWVFLVGTSSKEGLTNSIIWYYVILPYTHLTNTSYNKDRVVDDGWKSVILNSVQSIFRCCWNRQISGGEQHHQAEENSNCKPGPNNNKQRAAPIASEPTVSVISLEHSSKELDEKPCTSDGRQAAHDGNTIRNTLEHQSSTDSEADDYKRTPHKSRRLRMGESILSSMWDNINDEEAYSHYFRQLLELENPANRNIMSHYNNFQVVKFCKPIDKNTSFEPKRSVSNHNINGCSPKPIKSLKNSRFEEVPLNVNFGVDLIVRTKQRQTWLEGFLMHCDDEISYGNFINNLISFEEGLILD